MWGALGVERRVRQGTPQQQTLPGKACQQCVGFGVEWRGGGGEWLGPCVSSDLGAGGGTGHRKKLTSCLSKQRDRGGVSEGSVQSLQLSPAAHINKDFWQTAVLIGKQLGKVKCSHEGLGGGSVASPSHQIRSWVPIVESIHWLHSDSAGNATLSTGAWRG